MIITQTYTSSLFHAFFCHLTARGTMNHIIGTRGNRAWTMEEIFNTFPFTLFFF